MLCHELWDVGRGPLFYYEILCWYLFRALHNINDPSNEQPTKTERTQSFLLCFWVVSRRWLTRIHNIHAEVVVRPKYFFVCGNVSQCLLLLLYFFFLFFHRRFFDKRYKTPRRQYVLRFVIIDFLNVGCELFSRLRQRFESCCFAFFLYSEYHFSSTKDTILISCHLWCPSHVETKICVDRQKKARQIEGQNLILCMQPVIPCWYQTQTVQTLVFGGHENACHLFVALVAVLLADFILLCWTLSLSQRCSSLLTQCQC